MREFKANSAGFTLVELMVIIAIIAILLTVAVPMIRNIPANSQADSARQLLELDINVARNKAITFSENVLMTPNAGGFQDGWTITLKNSGEMIRQHKAFDDSVTVTSDTFTDAAPIEFDVEGRALLTGSLKISVDGCTGNRVYTMKLNMIGQLIVTEGPC
ncbi:MAG: GspH/FimT family protein [Thalassolituus oleivorans]|jgi:type IV fimbrial biogenesis protein FimT|uniref:GspH/FimT family pseudopilin n=1 Tax=Thalassolituus TaxID=187492 RepID=UPI000BC74E93|nr:GspH/FimT family protein [Thalassolituus oleivorans]MBQ0727235.1 GspH/FimT family protein [Thalassolituus oleivorans]MBQ0780771.1 GspH/FimT family protein [Thalassolituus oleivorans]MDF1642193.1 GspH/FimT family protein [Thalassolituus oleivorans]PCI46818.1 MAG: hypothetical protein COB43_13225 [Oceanospirillales bacterium]